jgi:hypothetical protein
MMPITKPISTNTKHLSRPFLLLSSLILILAIAGQQRTIVQAATSATMPTLQGDPFTIGGFYSDETAPAIAYSLIADQYLVVFQTNAGNGNVWGQYVDALTGNLVGDAVPIANDSTYYEGNPDVVYDSVHRRFLVVWDEYICIGVPAHCNYVIKGVVMHGSEQNGGSNFAGAPFTVASQWSSITTGDDLRDPAVAFNREDGQYGIVFLHGRENTGYPAIYGQIVDADYSDPTVLTPISGFDIWTTSTRELKTPDIAWSGGGNTFATAWNAERSDGNPNYIAISYLYDTYQNGGSQVMGSYLIAPVAPLQYDTRQPVIAYDENSGNYVTAFVHQEGSGSLSASTIRGHRIAETYNSSSLAADNTGPLNTASTDIVLSTFDIETTINADNDYHRNPGIAYSPSDKQMYVSYWTQNVETSGFQTDIFDWVYLRTLDSNNAVSERLQIRYAADKLLEHTAPACNPGGRCLIIWREEDTSSDWDIIGQLTNSSQYLYLPMIIK